MNTWRETTLAKTQQHSHSGNVVCSFSGKRGSKHVWILSSFPDIRLSVNLASDLLTAASSEQLFSPGTTPQKVSKWLLFQQV